MSDLTRSAVVHGHFYQPPREDPWLEEVETEPSAAPFHDWNQRVEAECYRAVVAARVPGAEGRIDRIVNTLAHLSFNFGPTLLDWMERAAPQTYAAILEADRISRSAHGGHGNAIAQPYHHTILPLASRRDKVTEVRWGIADFRRRFGRDPAGMWLPETAVDEETLEVLAQEGIAFTILAPHQVATAPARGLPGLVRLSGGRSIVVFVYDGGISHDVAFGIFLKDAKAWVSRLTATPKTEAGDPILVSVATDGETYGHHHRFGEMALAAVLQLLEARRDVRLENFASFLARHPAREEVRLEAPTSWSCVHGVERWRAACSCKMAPEKESQQAWRKPLREGLEWLATELHALYEAEAPSLVGDPWEVRNHFGEVDVTNTEEIARFLVERAGRSLEPPELLRARELLEMERSALRMFTSCGWFFDDLAGIESVQVLRYAARAIDLAGQDSTRLEEGLLRHLGEAETNEDPPRSGRDVYLQDVLPSLPPPARAAAGQVALRAAAPGSPEIPLRGFSIEERDGRVEVTQRRTGRRWEYEAVVEQPRTGRIRVRLTPASNPGGALTLTLDDLPDPHRSAVSEALRTALMGRCFTAREKAALAEGAGSVGDMASTALIDAVRKLEVNESAEALDRVAELADLVILLGMPIPFDAQTDYYRIREEADERRRTDLAALAGPLGFVIPQ